MLSVVKNFETAFVDGKNELQVYIPHILDFRGRVYLKNPFSFIEFKLLRYVLYSLPSQTFKATAKRGVHNSKFYHILCEYIPVLLKLEPN